MISPMTENGSLVLVCPDDLDPFADDLRIEDLIAKMKVIRVAKDEAEVEDAELVEFGSRRKK